MKHAVIVAHPKAESFNLTMAEAYAAAAREIGHEVVTRDLYRIPFDPLLKASEIPAVGFEAGDDVKAERALLKDVNVFCLVYPFWFNAPPAMMKGYIDRVFGMGFGFAPGAWGNDPLLEGRRMVSISSSGAPLHWVKETGAWDAVCNIFDGHFAAVCGMAVLDHLHFGDIVPGITEESVEDCAAEVRAGVQQLFGAQD